MGWSRFSQNRGSGCIRMTLPSEYTLKFLISPSWGGVEVGFLKKLDFETTLSKNWFCPRQIRSNMDNIY